MPNAVLASSPRPTGCISTAVRHEKPSFCFVSTTDWDAPQFGSRQQIARLLAQRGHQVLFVDVARALHSLISAPADTRRALGRMDRLRTVADGLTVYTPPPVLPIYYNPATNAVSQRLLLAYLRRALRRLAWPRLDVLWTYWPNSAYLVGRLGERMAVYHCIDALTAVKYPLTPPNAIAEMEAELCRKVDIIFAAHAGADRGQTPLQSVRPSVAGWGRPGSVHPTTGAGAACRARRHPQARAPAFSARLTTG